MDNYEHEDNEYSVDLTKIDDKNLSITRMMAARLIDNPYMSVGDFLQSISDRDLKTLCNILEEQFEYDQQGDDEIVEDFQDVVLISLMLAQAEGLTIEGYDDVERYTNTLGVLLTAEGLKRKGLVKMHYQNVSFGEDYADKIVAEKTDLFDQMMDDDEDEQ